MTTQDEPIAPDSKYYNPPIPEGRMNSFVATVRWVSAGALYQNQESEGRALFQPSFYGTDWFRKPEALRLDTTLEISRPGFGSDFDFTRFIARLRWHREIGFKNAVDGRFIGGLTGGDPPLEKLFALGGLNTLRGYEFRRIQGERMALVNLEWAFYPARAGPRSSASGTAAEPGEARPPPTACAPPRVGTTTWARPCAGRREPTSSSAASTWPGPSHPCPGRRAARE